uniref:LuxR family transcriptional regulator n=1 Tax=Adlercreutzia sp. ZJ141 TaxID=2709406 RepID=UPI0013EA407B
MGNRTENTTRMHVSSWGYACFLTVNATSTWGGIFPFLPIEFQTASVTLTFFLSQALAFGCAFVGSMLGAYLLPHAARRMMVTLVTLLVFSGSAFLIAAMYTPSGTLVWVGGGGVLLGVGSAGLFMLWQRYFASLPAEQGSFRLIVGTALAPALYFALYFVPIALTAFLVPLVLVPLCGLCISLSVREMLFDQPMFEDVPRQHPQVYRQVLADYWRCALCMGALAFASGIIRGIALLHSDIFALVNAASMIGSFVSAVALLIVWQRASFRFGMTTVFRITYPVLATGFLLLPFLGSTYLNIFAAATYMVFSLVQMLMMMQCAQISRDRGINPVFIYGFFGGVMYTMQSLGFLLGWISDGTSAHNQTWLFFLAMVSSYLLGLTLLASTGNLFKPQETSGTVTPDPIELRPLRTQGDVQEVMSEADKMSGGSRGKREQAASGVDSTGKRVSSKRAANKKATVSTVDTAGTAGAAASKPPKRRRIRASASPDADAIRDLISKKCLDLQ